MTKTLEEILTKLEKDFSELKEYAVKLEAENGMLRKELDKKYEDIPGNCAITLGEALKSAYIETDQAGFVTYISDIDISFRLSEEDPDELRIYSFHTEKISEIMSVYMLTPPSLISILAVILIHYGINIKIDIDAFDEEFITIFNEKFEYYKNNIKFRPVQS